VRKSSLVVLLLIAIIMVPLVALHNMRVLATDLDVLVADRLGEPQDIDPAWAYDTASAGLLMNVYESLIWFNRTNIDTFIPRLATSWSFTTINETSPEGIHWAQRLTFVMRTGVYFQSDGVNDIPGEGALLTSQNVEYTFERLLVTDAATGPSWMFWEPLFLAGWAGDLDAFLTGLGWPVNATTGWNTKMDEAIDHAIESNGTLVWFNLAMPYEPFLQILSQTWGGVLNQAWCVWHGDWPGPSIGDAWYLWHDPATSPLYSSDPSSPGPNLDAALGTGPYMLDYWNRGGGGAWSIIKNPNYWEGWTVPFRHTGWGSSELAIGGHVDRYTSNYIPEWSTRKFRFLGGVSDLCDVPTSYDQVLGQPGIQCIYPLPQLIADACFFNFLIGDTSTHLGAMQSNSTFSQYGAPPNMMNDTNFRLAIAHMFDYTNYLSTAFLNMAVSPVTPIIPGISYYDASIGQTEDPAINQSKKYGITGELAGQLAYDLNLAKTYLQLAWGGQLWANGFTFDAVYNEGNIRRQIAATLMRNAFGTMNALYGTKFTINIVSLPWNLYRTEWRQRRLPYFIYGWLADYPDAHDFAYPFMHSNGAFSQYQGYNGVTSFPNSSVDSYIEAGIATVDPAARQGNYSWLQQYYVNNAPGFCTDQPTSRHFQRDWVQGWYYNSIYPGNYIYDLWKNIGVPLYEVDVAAISFSEVDEIKTGYTPQDNTVIVPPSRYVCVTVRRLDGNTYASDVPVVVGLGVRNETSGREVILGVITTDLTCQGQAGDTRLVIFYDFEHARLDPGNYTIFAEVLVSSGSATDINDANNRVEQGTPVEVIYLGALVPVDLTVTYLSSVNRIGLGLPTLPYPSPVEVTVSRSDNSSVMVRAAIHVGLLDEASGTEAIMGTCIAWLGWHSYDNTYTAEFLEFELDPSTVIEPGKYKILADVLAEAAYNPAAVAVVDSNNVNNWHVGGEVDVFASVPCHSWSMFRHDIKHTGYIESPAPNTNQTLWSYTTGNWVVSSPTVADGKVYVGSDDGNVYALDQYSGTQIWNVTTGGAVWSAVAVMGDKVCFGSFDSLVYCLDASTGSQVWNYTTGGSVGSSPAVAGNRVFVGSDDRRVYCLDALNGSQVWNYTTLGGVRSSPAVADGKVYVGSDDRRVYCLDASTGSQVWNYTTGGLVESSPAVADGVVFVGSYDGKVYALGQYTGTCIWNYTTGDVVWSSPAVVSGKVCFGSFDGNVLCLDATTGTKIWNLTTGGSVASSPAVADGKVYVGSDDRRVYCLDASTGSQVWNYTTGGLVESSPAVADGVVFLGSDDGIVYAFGNVVRSQDYRTIQNATDAASQGATVWIAPGDYNESIVIDKPLMIIGLVGSAPVFRGGGSGTAIILVASASGSIIVGVVITNWDRGILVADSMNCKIYNNIMSNMSKNGIVLEGSNAANNLIYNNIFQENAIAINLTASSAQNTVYKNIITSNSIGLKLESGGNTIYANSIAQNVIGINISSSGNTIYHNNFVDNTVQASISLSAINTWDDGYSSGGNYWGMCACVDLYSGEGQNQPGSDGINDTGHVIDEINKDRYPLVHPFSEHDIGIAAFITSITVLPRGLTVNIDVIILNYGASDETFTITIFADTIVIGMQTVTMVTRSSMVVTVACNTVGVANGDCTIRAVVDVLPGETDTADNVLTYGTIMVTIPGDVTGDFWVDMQDISIMIDNFMATPPNWNPCCDINNDLIVDMADISIAIHHFMQP
jgi:parallel beta-helix repeat protein